MQWQRSKPQAWPDQPGVAVLEAEPGEARDGVVTEWLAEHKRAGATIRILPCRPQRGGIWAGVVDLIEGIVPEVRERAPHLLEAHAQELSVVLPALRPELNPLSTLTDDANDEEKTRNYAADRAYRNLHGLIDLMDEWHELAGRPLLAFACDDYDTANNVVRRFFAELVRRRGTRLGLRLLVVAGPGAGNEVAAGFDPATVIATVRLTLPGPAPVTPSPDAMARMATALEEEIEAGAVASETVLPRLIECWKASGSGDSALRWQVRAMYQFNHDGLYEASLVYAREVEEGLDRLYAIDPELYFTAVNALYFCYVPLGRAEAARVALEQATDRLTDPSSLPRCYYLLAMLHGRFLSPLDLDRAEDYLRRGLDLLATVDMAESERHFLSVFLMNGLALIRLRQRRLDEALELCRAGVRRLNEHLDPTRHRLHRSVLLFNIAQVHAQIGPYEDAVSYFSQAMAMDPNYSEYYNDRGAVSFKMDRLEEAEADYLQAIQLSPPYAEVWVNLGQCYRSMERMEDAVAAYSRALDLDAAVTLALVGRADAHAALGDTGQAMADYDRALAIDPAQPLVLASRAILHYEAGRLVEAVEDLDAAVALAPDVPDLHQNRAVALRDLGRHGEAEADLTTYLALSPDAEDRAEVEGWLSSLEGAR